MSRFANRVTPNISRLADVTLFLVTTPFYHFLSLRALALTPARNKQNDLISPRMDVSTVAANKGSTGETFLIVLGTPL
jgi:hypothetical protein